MPQTNALPSPTNRSRLTNARMKGKVSARSLFTDGDGRSPWARRYRDLVAALCDDLGGMAGMSELRLGLVRRCAALMAECERLENQLAAGQAADLDLLARTSSHLRRLGETLGIDRVKRDVTPTINDLVAASSQSKPKEAAHAAAPVSANLAPPLPTTPAGEPGKSPDEPPIPPAIHEVRG